MLEVIASACRLLAGTALVVLTVIFGWLVYGRYVLNATPTWVEQVSLLLVVLITFIGAAVGIRDQTHLGVSYFREICPRWLRFGMTVASHLVLVGFGGVMAYAGFQLAVFKWGSEIPLLNIPEGWRAVPIAVGGGLVCLFSIGNLVGMRRGQRPEPAAAALAAKNAAPGA